MFEHNPCLVLCIDTRDRWIWTETLAYIYTGTTDLIFGLLLVFLYYSEIVWLKSDFICLDSEVEMIHMPEIINKHTFC